MGGGGVDSREYIYLGQGARVSWRGRLALLLGWLTPVYVSPITSPITTQSLPLPTAPSNHFRLATTTSVGYLYMSTYSTVIASPQAPDQC